MTTDPKFARCGIVAAFEGTAVVKAKAAKLAATALRVRNLGVTLLALIPNRSERSGGRASYFEQLLCAAQQGKSSGCERHQKKRPAEGRAFAVLGFPGRFRAYDFIFIFGFA